MIAPQQKRIAALIGLTLVGFGGLCGYIIGAAAVMPLCGLEGNIVAMQGEIEVAR